MQESPVISILSQINPILRIDTYFIKIHKYKQYIKLSETKSAWNCYIKIYKTRQWNYALFKFRRGKREGEREREREK